MEETFWEYPITLRMCVSALGVTATLLMGGGWSVYVEHNKTPHADAATIEALRTIEGQQRETFSTYMSQQSLVLEKLSNVVQDLNVAVAELRGEWRVVREYRAN